MASVTFDTLKFANTLKAAGVSPVQAEAEATALAEALEVNFRDLVTKDDLQHASELVRRDIQALEQRLVIKLGAMLALSVGLVAALVKLL